MSPFWQAVLGNAAAQRPATLTPPMIGAPTPAPPSALTAAAPTGVPMGGGGGNLMPILQALGIGISRNDLSAGAALIPTLMQNQREQGESRRQSAQTLAYLQEQGDTDLVQGVQSGAMTPAKAFEMSLSRKSEKEKERKETLTASETAESKRRIEKDPNGIPRYTDTGEPVFPDVNKAPDAKQVAAQEKAAAQEETKRQQADMVLGAINDVRTDLQRGKDAADSSMIPNMLEGDRVTGLAGTALSFIPGTNASNMASALGSIKANIGFDKLQEMRANSPTGGALGPVSDYENKLLQATFSALEQSQSRDRFIENLAEVEKIYWRIVNEGINPDGSPKTKSGVPSVNNSAATGWTVKVKEQ